MLVWVLAACGAGAPTAGTMLQTITPPAAPGVSGTPTPTTPPLPTVTSAPVSEATATHTPPGPDSTPTGSGQETTPSCSGHPGQMVQAEIETPRLNHPLAFRIYLPPCYGLDPALRYPVLYLLHGQTYTDDQWDRIGADEAAETLIAAGELPPFLIVMPYDRGWRRPDQDRFGETLVEDLVPWIDAHYPTRAEREYRAIGGLSRGAAWAVHLGLNHWDLFGSVGAHSLALFWADAPYLAIWIDAIPGDTLPRFYLDTGRSDPHLLSTQEFEQLLSDKDVPHTWRLFTGYHDEAYWSAHVEGYLRLYGEKWRTESRE